MQEQGYPSHGRKLVKTSVPGIYKRGGRYVVIVRDPSGKPRKHAATTMKEARGKKAALTADVQRGEWRETSRVTFAEFATTWVATYGGRTSKGIEEHTRRGYERVLVADAIPYFGRMRLSAITAQHLQAFALHVASRGVMANTVRLALAPVKCLLADAHAQGLIRSNPAAGLRIALPPSTRKAGSNEDAEDDEGEVKALTDDELARLLDVLPEEWRLFFEFLGETGLRIGEAIEVRARDVDLDERWLHVRRRFYRGAVGKPKGRKTRRVRLSVAMAGALAPRVAGIDDDALLFTAEQGGRIDQSNLMGRVLKPAAVRAGLGEWVEGRKPRAESWVGFHTFRHTCATRLFRGGWHAVAVQKFLGHTDPGFTLRTYVHLLAEDLPEVPFGQLAPVTPLRKVAAA